MKSILDHIRATRTDVTWIKGPNGQGEYQWDNALPNQAEIASLVNSYNPNAPLTNKEIFDIKIEKSQEFGKFFVRDFGSDNMELLYSGQITYPQIMQMMTELEPMIARLYAGSLELAKVWIQTYKTTVAEIDRPYLNDSRINYYIAKIDEFLVTL